MTWERNKRSRDVICCKVPKNPILLRPIIYCQVCSFVVHFFFGYTRINYNL